MVETIVTIGVIGIAAAFVGRAVRRAMRGNPGCGPSGCPSSCSCAVMESLRTDRHEHSAPVRAPHA